MPADYYYCSSNFESFVFKHLTQRKNLTLDKTNFKPCIEFHRDVNIETI